MSAIIYDRLYGRIVFPKIIHSLLTDPALLRLREVTMANVPMFRFPSFSSVTRYEHSIGVCHLAEIAANSLDLSVKDKIELMLACLYHDVGTPPFAHATEEVLAEHYGFDHEQHLHDLLIGKSEDLGFEKSQIYLGRGLKLHRVVKNKTMRKIGVEVDNIAKYANGKNELGSLVSGDLDLDNMDNVVRSASSMGLFNDIHKLPEYLSKSFNYFKGVISMSGLSINNINKWKRIRKSLYNHLYADIIDFSLQTMLKHILNILVEKQEESFLSKYDWLLTDNELIDKIKKDNETNEILTNMKLGKTYPCLSMIEVNCDQPDESIIKNIKEIKKISEEGLGIECIVNYYIDKRERYIMRPIISFGVDDKLNNYKKKTSIIVGIFTPLKSIEGRSNRKKFTKLQKRHDIPDIISNKLNNNYIVKKIKIYDDKIVTSSDVI